MSHATPHQMSFKERNTVSRHRKRLTSMLAVALTAGAVVGCGSNDKASSSSSGTTGAAQPAAAKVDVAAAKKILAPYTGHPSAFPVDQPLKKRPTGAKFAYLQCSTPVCGLIGQLTDGATKMMGVKLTVTKAGPSADALQGAMNSILEDKPAAVVLPAVEPSAINTQLATLKSDKIPVVSNGLMNDAKYGISAAMVNTPSIQVVGQVLAAKAVADKGASANIVLYTTPELSFGPVLKAAFQAKIGELCSACKVRYVDIPVATIGNAAPARVVSDLQANPKTNVTVFSTLEAAVGLPAALKTAGLSPDITGFAPNPVNLQDLKAGKLSSALGVDLAVSSWALVDAAARLDAGQPLTAGEKKGFAPMQMLEPSDITFDPSHGYTGYPDFPKRFAKLWGIGA